VDYTNRDYEGFRSAMITDLQSRLPEYTDISSSDAGIVILELLAFQLDILSYYIDVLANEVLMTTARERSTVIEHTKKLGYTMKNSIPAQFYQIFEINVQGTDFTIPSGFRLKTIPSLSEETQYFETDEDLVIPAGMTGLEQTDGEYDYKVSVTHGYTVEDDILGTSDETENQEFQLANSGAIDSSIIILVNEGSGFEEWTKVDNFIDSESTSKHYLLSIDENQQATIQFGNGVTGKIPTTFVDGIGATYRVGGGIVGNVGTNTIIGQYETLSGIVSTTNPETAYTLGEEPEDIEIAKVNALAKSQTLQRAVTLEDYENLAVLDWSARKVKAIWNESIRVIEVYILDQTSDTMTQTQIDNIQEYYDEKKVVGTTNVVYNPDYQTVDVTINVTVLEAFQGQIATKTTEINTQIDSFFSVGTNDFGEDFSPSKLITQIMTNVTGLQAVFITTPSAVVSMSDSQIFTKGTITLTVT